MVPAPSLVPPVVLLGPVAPPPAFALLACTSGFPSALPAPPFSLLFSLSSSGVSVGLSTSASGGASPSASRGSSLDFSCASGASDSPDDVFLYHGFDDSSIRGRR